jgi:hypothetical protein
MFSKNMLRFYQLDAMWGCSFLSRDMACGWNMANILGVENYWFIDMAVARNLWKGKIIFITIDCGLKDLKQTIYHKGIWCNWAFIKYLLKWTKTFKISILCYFKSKRLATWNTMSPGLIYWPNSPVENLINEFLGGLQ